MDYDLRHVRIDIRVTHGKLTYIRAMMGQKYIYLDIRNCVENV